MKSTEEIPPPSLGPNIPVTVTIMIATRNRIAELKKTLTACLNHDWPYLEILVVDDASTDGTFEQVRSQFPQVKILRWEKNLGSIAARNEILRRATGKYIIGLDDDSRFIDPDSCRRVVHRMEAEPDLGIISFQAIGPEFPAALTETGRLQGEWHCSSFAACGVAIRRSIFEKTGPLVDFFFHAYEEPDLCIRAWDAGYRVLQWNDLHVYHEYSSLNRNERITHQRHACNEACSTWMRCPWYVVPPLTLARLAAQCYYAASRGWLIQEPRVWANFLLKLPQSLLHRKPVSTKTLKICLAVNRIRVADARAVWELGNLSWRAILRKKFPAEIPIVGIV